MRNPVLHWLGHSANLLGASLRYRLQRAAYDRAFSQMPRLEGPVLVIGSAPGSEIPRDVTADWQIVAVNSSQAVTDAAGLPAPSLTVFRDRILVPGKHQEGVWEILAGRTTAVAVPIIATSADRGFAAEAEKRGYHAQSVAEISRHDRGALIREMSGTGLVDLIGPYSISNGMFAAVLALKLGAAPVVLAGFSTHAGRSGFAGSPPRLHVKGDRTVGRRLRQRKLPVFAADPAYARSTGLRRWPPKARPLKPEQDAL